MKQRKSPAVTSPWKIGLLVSLLIAVTGAGVAYLVTRTFNISWTWVNLEPGNYAFYFDQFQEQMFPQLALVLITCLVAYLSITSAVRKYRAYLDSGLDYKQLIQSIKHVEDLEDESAFKKLNKYPELKSFFGEMRNSLKQRDCLIEQQNADLEASAFARDYEAQVKSECETLITVIRDKIAQGERRELNLELSNPELQEVANAILEIPVRRESACGDAEKERMAELHQNLREASDFIAARLEDISGDLVGSRQEAKSIESQINALKQIVDPTDTAGQDDEKIRTLEQISTGVADISQLSETLAELSEETKSIAINSALQAGSGEGTLTDLIQLAEGVKEIAMKYERSASSYSAVTGDLSGQISRLHKLLRDDSASPEAIITSTVNTLSSKMSLWVERIVVLSDKIKTLEKSYRVSFQTLKDRIGGYAALRQEEDAAFEIEKTELLQMHAEAAAAPDAEASMCDNGGGEPGSDTDGFSGDLEETPDPSFRLEDPGSDASGAEIPVSGFDGIVQERNIFESTQDEEDAYFAGRSIGIQDQFDKIESNAAGEEFQDEPDPREGEADSYQDLGAVQFDMTSPAGDAGEARGDADMETAVIPDDSPGDAVQELEEEIFDLYALGAVDYVAHHSEQQP